MNLVTRAPSTDDLNNLEEKRVDLKNHDELVSRGNNNQFDGKVSGLKLSTFDKKLDSFPTNEFNVLQANHRTVLSVSTECSDREELGEMVLAGQRRAIVDQSVGVVTVSTLSPCDSLKNNVAEEINALQVEEDTFSAQENEEELCSPEEVEEDPGNHHDTAKMDKPTNVVSVENEVAVDCAEEGVDEKRKPENRHSMQLTAADTVTQPTNTQVTSDLSPAASASKPKPVSLKMWMASFVIWCLLTVVKVIDLMSSVRHARQESVHVAPTGSLKEENSQMQKSVTYRFEEPTECTEGILSDQDCTRDFSDESSDEGDQPSPPRRNTSTRIKSGNNLGGGAMTYLQASPVLVDPASKKDLVEQYVAPVFAQNGKVKAKVKKKRVWSEEKERRFSFPMFYTQYGPDEVRFGEIILEPDELSLPVFVKATTSQLYQDLPQGALPVFVQTAPYPEEYRRALFTGLRDK